MPTFQAFEHAILPFLLATMIALGFAVLLSLLLKTSAKIAFPKVLVFITPYALLGTVLGYVAGSSKEEIIGALLTGVLTLVGALLSYAFSQNAVSEWRDLLPPAVAALAIGALAGISAGQINRSAEADYERQYSRWLIQFEKVDVPAMALKVRHNDCVQKVSPQLRAKCDELLLK